MAETIARSSAGAVTYLAPSGSLAEEPVQAALREAFESCVASGKTTLVLDLHRVSLLNGKALEIIVEANAKLTGRGGRLQFADASPLVRDILVANRIIDGRSAPAHGRHAVHAFGAQPLREPRKKLGEILVEMNLLTEEQLEKALRSQATSSKRLGEYAGCPTAENKAAKS